MGSGTTVGTGRFPVTTVMMQGAGGIFSVLFVRSVVKIPACAAEARRFGVAKARERLPSFFVLRSLFYVLGTSHVISMNIIFIILKLIRPLGNMVLRR